MEVFRNLLPYLRKHIKQLLIGLFGMGIFTLLSLLPPLLLRFLVDEVVELSRWQLLLPAVAAIIAIPLTSELLRFGNTQIIMKSGYKLISDIRTDLYRKIMYLSMRFHQDKSSGLLVNRLMDDVNMLQHLITGETVNIIIDLVVFIFSVTIVFIISPPLSIILLVTLLLYIIAYRIFAGRIRRQTALYRSKQDLISERLQETTAGVRHVRIFNREFNENNQFMNRTNESLSHALSGNLGSVGLSTVCTFIAGFGSAVMVGIGAYMVIEGELKYGDVLAVSNYVWMALNPAIRLTNLAGQLTEIFVSVRRLGEILNEDIDIKSEPGAPSIRADHGRVEFRDVRFSYKPDVPLYRSLSLSVEAGQTAALVGHTGCGKTTLTALLMRYWDIQSGSIRIDGQDQLYCGAPAFYHPECRYHCSDG
jgi:ABC-type multidrug transport system fused ATPase/permease subunit